jgi:hypothetical protein
LNASSVCATIRSAKKRKFSAARRAWPSACVIGRPESNDSSSAARVARLDDVGDAVQHARALARAACAATGPR